MNRPWLLQVDGDLMDRSRIFLNMDYDRNEYLHINLRDPARFPDNSAKLYYTMKGGRIAKLEKYDLYPAGSGIPLVSERMRDLIIGMCDPAEVAFFPAIVTSKYGEELVAWNLAPRVLLPCIDFEKSDVVYSEVNASLPRRFRKLAFLDDCLNGFDIVRAADFGSFILVSDRLKTAMEGLNPTGMLFVRDEDYQPILK